MNVGRRAVNRGCFRLFLTVLIVLPVILLLVFLDIITVSFSKLGLSPTAATAILVAALVGSVVNIPITRHQIVYEDQRTFYSRFLFYLPPRITSQVVAVNLGGAIIPVGLAAYVLPKAAPVPTLIAAAAVTVVARLLARPVPGVGIVLPAWISPLISAGLAFLLARANPAPVAYISGTIGTLVGADLLNWPNFKKLGSHMISIGGAGVFDGVFFAGIIAVLIA